MFDSHVHLVDGPADSGDFLRKLDSIDLEGAAVISRKPQRMYHYPNDMASRYRIDNLLEFCDDRSRLYPIFFIDPLEEDAMRQIDYAVEKGVMGFKVLCNTYYASDPKAMEVFTHIAAYDKPILFHTGILYDGRNPSTRFNMPGQFDCLFTIEGLRFCFAHISWPWCDECISLFGKFENSKSKYPHSKTQMYIDIAPGTPPAYRKDALTKLFGFEYPAEDYVMFGTDGAANRYDVDYTKFILEEDDAIFREICFSDASKKKIYHDNLLKFLGL